MYDELMVDDNKQIDEEKQKKVNEQIKLNSISVNTLAYGKFTNQETYLNLLKMNNQLSSKVRDIMTENEEQKNIINRKTDKYFRRDYSLNQQKLENVYEQN